MRDRQKISKSVRERQESKDEMQLTFDIFPVWVLSINGKEMTDEEKKEWIAKNTNVALGSDAFFPFGDNIERAKKSGVSVIAQPGGSVRDDHVIMTANKYDMVMSFTGIRLFHH